LYGKKPKVHGQKQIQQQMLMEASYSLRSKAVAGVLYFTDISNDLLMEARSKPLKQNMHSHVDRQNSQRSSGVSLKAGESFWTQRQKAWTVCLSQ
jgi:hypothetical protein